MVQDKAGIEYASRRPTRIPTRRPATAHALREKAIRLDDLRDSIRTEAVRAGRVSRELNFTSRIGAISHEEDRVFRDPDGSRLPLAGTLSAYVLLSPRRTWDQRSQRDRGQPRPVERHRRRPRAAAAPATAITASAAWNGAGSGTLLNATVGSVSGFRLGDGSPMLNFTDPHAGLHRQLPRRHLHRLLPVPRQRHVRASTTPTSSPTRPSPGPRRARPAPTRSTSKA